MIKNIGSPDRIIRILVAVAIALLYFTNLITGTLGVILLIIAGVLLITALAGTCPLYMLLGMRTTKTAR